MAAYTESGNTGMMSPKASMTLYVTLPSGKADGLLDGGVPSLEIRSRVKAREHIMSGNSRSRIYSGH